MSEMELIIELKAAPADHEAEATANNSLRRDLGGDANTHIDVLLVHAAHIHTCALPLFRININDGGSASMTEASRLSPRSANSRGTAWHM